MHEGNTLWAQLLGIINIYLVFHIIKPPVIGIFYLATCSLIID